MISGLPGHRRRSKLRFGFGCRGAVAVVLVWLVRVILVVSHLLYNPERIPRQGRLQGVKLILFSSEIVLMNAPKLGIRELIFQIYLSHTSLCKWLGINK